MDRISDSGSDGLGSNPDGSTTTVKSFSPDEMNRQGFAKDLACSRFVMFQEFDRGRESGQGEGKNLCISGKPIDIQMERKDSM